MENPDTRTKALKIVAIHLLLFAPLMAFVLISIAVGTCSISYRGISVDRDQNLYIGKEHELIVVDPDGLIIRSMDVPTSRGYSFTVTNSDEIIFDTGGTLHFYDLEGNKLCDPKEGSDDRIPGSTWTRNVAYSEDGTKYVLQGVLLRTNVYRIRGAQKELLYQMPVFDVMVKLGLYLCFALLISMMIHLFKNGKSRLNRQSRARTL